MESREEIMAKAIDQNLEDIQLSCDYLRHLLQSNLDYIDCFEKELIERQSQLIRELGIGL